MVIVYVPPTVKLMVFPPGVAFAAWIAERSVTTPAGGVRMSAKLFTLKTAGTRRFSNDSNLNCRRNFLWMADFLRVHNRLNN